MVLLLLIVVFSAYLFFAQTAFFRRRQRVFGIIAGAGVALLMLGAIAYGVASNDIGATWMHLKRAIYSYAIGWMAMAALRYARQRRRTADTGEPAGPAPDDADD